MLRPRKLTFQLTPLLDLLLIVIFAQYMEVRETADARQIDMERQTSAREAELESEHDRRLAALIEQRDELEQTQTDLAEFRREVADRETDLREALDVALEREQRVGDIVSELFQVPEAMIDDLVTSGDRGLQARTPEQQQELREAFRELAELRGAQAIKHLLTYEELRKRCDIWELYIAADGVVTFDAGERTKRFRFREAHSNAPRTAAEIETENEQAAEQFARRVFEFYKTLPQAKDVVIMLLSYSETTSYNWRRPALLGLSEAADRMRADSSGRTRFEYAVIGPLAAPGAALDTP